MVAHFSFLAAAAFLPVLGFILLPVAVAVLMFKHWNGFGLHIVADRAVTLSGTSLGFGGRGRPRRVGPIDIVATRYGVHTQGATTIALTKLDVLSYMDRIPVCTKYVADGTETEKFPFPAALADAKPRLCSQPVFLPVLSAR